jgi:CheY-like chemotaxis protein
MRERGVHVVDSAERALDFVFCRGDYSRRSMQHPARVVVLDLALPRSSGFAVLERIKTDPRTRPIPVVVLTSSSCPDDVMRGYHLGANSYIRKSVDLPAFREAVHLIARYWLTLNELPRIDAA